MRPLLSLPHGLSNFSLINALVHFFIIKILIRNKCMLTVVSGEEGYGRDDAGDNL